MKTCFICGAVWSSIIIVCHVTFYREVYKNVLAFDIMMLWSNLEM